MKLLTLTEQHTLHHRYKLNDLYRQWSPILAFLQRKYNEADAQSLWHVAEQQIVRLRSELAFREQEIAPIYNELLIDCQKFGEAHRSKEQAQHSATTIMCIMLTMLMNSVEKGHEDETFDNEPMCMAVLDIFSKDAYFQNLMNFFFNRNKGYDGQKVFITPSDPMKDGVLFKSIDEVAQEEIQQLVGDIIGRTQGLQILFGEYWSAWKPLWQDILADTDMLLLLRKKEPRGTNWNINEKMVCNVVGLVKNIKKLEATYQSLNAVLSSNNRRSYLSNIADYKSTDCVFSREQSDRIRQLIEKHFLSQTYK